MSNQHPLLPKQKTRQTKDRWSRTLIYLAFQDLKQQPWYLPDLEGFRDYLLLKDGLAPATVAVYISSVKQAFRELLHDYKLRQYIRNTVPYAALNETVKQAEQAIAYAIQKDTAPVDYERPEAITHPTHDDIMALIGQIDIQTPMDLRDLLVISLILFTGMSEVEVCELTIDHFDDAGGKYIQIPEVSGGKERGVLIREDLFFTSEWWVETYYSWKRGTGIRSGPMFRGFYRGGKTHRKNKMDPTSIQKMLKKYPINAPDEPDRHLTAQDLRRAYARRLFCIEDNFDAIGENLGYDDPRTIRGYVGLPNAQSHEEAKRRGDGDQILNRVNKFLDRRK